MDEDKMLLLIDNYDSFTWNLVHYLSELGADVVVKRNDALDVQEAMAMRPDAILLSPGPCDPSQAGICLALVHAAAETKMPLMGVCLGHQAIGLAFGGSLKNLSAVHHGVSSSLQILQDDYLFENFGDKRYLTNIIGGAFLLGSLLSVIFIEEDLRRYQKDVEIREEKIDSINSNEYKDNEEYLINSKKNSYKSTENGSSVI